MEQFIQEFIASIEPNPALAPELLNTFRRVVKKYGGGCDLTKECIFDITLPKSVCGSDSGKKNQYSFNSSFAKDINLHELATRIETKFDCVVTDYDSFHLRAVFKHIDKNDTSVQEYIDDYTCKRWIETTTITTVKPQDLKHLQSVLDTFAADANHVVFFVYQNGHDVGIKSIFPGKYTKIKNDAISHIANTCIVGKKQIHLGTLVKV